MTNEIYDAVIIGAGAGGGATAWALTKPGLRVLILDAGPAYDPYSDYSLDEPTWVSSKAGVARTLYLRANAETGSGF